MELRFLDRGTPLSIEFLTRDLKPLSDEKFTGKFYDMENVMTFFITSDELFKRFDEFDTSCYLRISFQRGTDAYTFTGKLNSTVKKSRQDLILITATSLLEKSEIRNAPRIEISLPVNIHKIAPGAPNQAGELLLRGSSQDISNTGMCVYSDTYIEKQDGSAYIAEFSITGGKVFYLRAKLMRSERSPVVSYKYAYGFLFEYGENAADEKSDLAMFMLKYRTSSDLSRLGSNHSMNKLQNSAIKFSK